MVTTPTDQRTKDVVAQVPNARCYETDAFYRYGAKFNKGLAMEEGLENLGREGWICIFDADTLFPDVMPLELTIGNLYTPPRLILEDPRLWSPVFNWATATPSNDRQFPGYFQLFHASDPNIAELPWYDVTSAHAGLGDGYFQSRWAPQNKIRPNFNVLHLGPRDTNWFGRSSVRVDGTLPEQAEQHKQAQEEFLHFKGWHRPKTSIPDYSERVDVPNAQPLPWKH